MPSTSHAVVLSVGAVLAGLSPSAAVRVAPHLGAIAVTTVPGGDSHPIGTLIFGEFKI